MQGLLVRIQDVVGSSPVHMPPANLQQHSNMNDLLWRLDSAEVGTKMVFGVSIPTLNPSAGPPALSSNLQDCVTLNTASF